MSWRDEQGFTLVEVVVALFILVTVVLGMLNVYNTGFILTEKAGDRTAALNLAQRKLEEIKGGISPVSGTTGQSVGGFTYQINVQDVSSADYPNLYQVEITVQYPTANDRSGELSLTTMVRER